MDSSPATDDWTPLMRAAAAADPAGVRSLLGEANARPRALGAGNWTALALAALAGSEECARLLLPFSDASQATADGKTPLMWAARMGHAKCAARLLPASDPDARDARGKSALFLAIENLHVDCVALLAPKTNPALPDGQGNPAVVFAAERGSAPTLRALLAGRKNVFLPGELEAARAVALSHGFHGCATLLLAAQQPA